MPISQTVTFAITGVLRKDCGGVSEFALAAGDVQAALLEVEERYPALHRNLCDETGAVRRHIALFVNTDHIRDREGLATPLLPGDVLVALPAVSGG